ncbi:Uncharacterized protein TCM_000422 [Theobroma cacao]|uniref:Uncharacterized protein n=1 Tax=Theobroma cacao TaxID=3641 RepID=A0A061DHB1_THECC|nr:Uncharacterized protein TCM_000422 [Theobroma cacao]
MLDMSLGFTGAPPVTVLCSFLKLSRRGSRLSKITEPITIQQLKQKFGNVMIMLIRLSRESTLLKLILTLMEINKDGDEIVFGLILSSFA